MPVQKAIEVSAAELIEAEAVLDPDADALTLAARAISHADAEFLQELHATLTLRYFATVARQLRLAAARESAYQLPLPGFEHVRPRIGSGKRNRTPLEESTITRLRIHLRAVRKRRAEDPEVVELAALIKLMEPHAKETPGITVKEVMERETTGGQTKKPAKKKGKPKQ